MKTMHKVITVTILLIALFASVMGIVYWQNVSLPQFATVSTCTGFNDIALSSVDYISNDPKLNGKAWLLTVVQNCFGRYAVGTIDNEEIKDVQDNAKAEYDLKISTSVDEQKCEYGIKVDGQAIKHMDHQTEEIWYNPLVGEAGCADWFKTNCYNKPNYVLVAGRHPTGLKTWCSCFFTTTSAAHGIIETPSVTFKSTITLEAKGEKYSETISSTGPGSVWFDNNIAYVYWNGNLVSGEQCPIAADYRVSTAYINGIWRTIDENKYQSYITYDSTGFENCVDRYVDYGSETPQSCVNNYNAYESNAISGKDLTSTGGSKATTYGTITNGKVILELSKLIQYPLLSMRINANWIGVFIPVGKPSITFVQSQPFQTGTTGIVDVEVKNVGTGLGSFGVYAECPSPFSQKTGTETIQLYPQEVGKVSLTLVATCGEDTSKSCTVYAYDKNNPAEKVSKTFTATCKPIVLCTANIETRCNGNYIERCNAQGTGWTQIEKCDYGCIFKEGNARCDEETKKCNFNRICEPNLGETINSCPTDCWVVTCNNNFICESNLGENAQNCSDCQQDIIKYLPYIVLALVLGVAAIVIYKRRKGGRRKYYGR